ncbi:esterase-like activity of phytase family protein [Novispirillum sp. DQ9]|uniref:esterase-like activity of phytase family protein n=1 Tax=Novispirillum sp. DQ9 TaxID=3398612 RepID=UPI003C7E6D70
MAILVAAALSAAACGPPPPLAARPSGDAFSSAPLFHDGAPWTAPQVEGALHLSSAEPRFGGWSGLALDGSTLTAVSDRGYFLRLTLTPGGAQGLAVGEPRFGILPDADGAPLRGALRDAEEVLALPGGGLVVSFEREHRLWLYPPADKPFGAPPRPLPAPPGMADLPYNGGVEALARLPDGRLLVLAEDGADDAGTTAAWVGTPADDSLAEIAWSPLRLKGSDGYKPTAAAPAANGDLLVLERAFSIPAGFTSRIRRIPADRLAPGMIAPGAVLDGPVVVRLDRPPVNDNFEGMATTPLPDGSTRVLVMTDDNYSGLQRTLLLSLRL